MSALEDPTVVAALVAVVGVLVSALVSARVSRSEAEQARRNLLLEFSRKFNDRLYEKRLEVYPPLYATLSRLGKRFLSPDLSRRDFSVALKQIEEWDTRNAVYVSPSVIALLLNIRNLLSDAVRLPESGYPSDMEVKSLFEAALRLEQALKQELGVYSTSDFFNPPLYTGPAHSWRPPPPAPPRDVH